MGIGESLRQKRLADQALQADVAEQIGVSQASYSAWERGESIPKVQHIAPIAEFLGMSESEVIRAVFAPSEDGDRLEQLTEDVAKLRRDMDGVKRRLAKLERPAAHRSGR